MKINKDINIINEEKLNEDFNKLLDLFAKNGFEVSDSVDIELGSEVQECCDELMREAGFIVD